MARRILQAVTARRPPRSSRDGEPSRRGAYAVVLVLSIALLGHIALVGSPTASLRGALFGALGLYDIAVLGALLTHRLRPGQVESLLLAPVAPAMLGLLLLWRLAPDQLGEGFLEPTALMAWVALTFPLAFLAGGPRRGTTVSIGILTAFIAITVVPIFVVGPRPGANDPSPLAAASLAMLFTLLIALLRVLTIRREELAAAQAETSALAKQAHTDPLTGLANRRLLDDELARQVAVARRRGRPLSALLLDLDHFKTVNDRFGHVAGDRVLVELAQRLDLRDREGDLLGRWGGEELLVLAPHTTIEEGRALGERLRARVADAPFGEVGRVTISVGVACLEEDDTVRSLLQRADLALYAAKDAGRDRVVALCGQVPGAAIGAPAGTG